MNFNQTYSRRTTVSAARYTAILSGNGGATGIGLVEIHKVR